jgi:hypothetical protein
MRGDRKEGRKGGREGDGGRMLEELVLWKEEPGPGTAVRTVEVR